MRSPASNSAFAKLVWLSSHFDSLTGGYFLACDRDKAETDRALRLAHALAFAEWLGYSLREQAADLGRYLSQGGDGDARFQLKSWLAGRDCACLVPEDALEVDRSLFESDLKVVLQLLGGVDPRPRPGNATGRASARSWDCWRARMSFG